MEMRRDCSGIVHCNSTSVVENQRHFLIKSLEEYRYSLVLGEKAIALLNLEHKNDILTDALDFVKEDA